MYFCELKYSLLLVNGMERTNHIADVMNCMRDITWFPLTLILTKTQKKNANTYVKLEMI